MAGIPIPLGRAGEEARANLERIRTARGLGYAELSRRLQEAGRNIPPLGLSRIERGERRIDIDDLEALSRALGVAPAELAPSLSSTADEAVGVLREQLHAIEAIIRGRKEVQ